MSFTICSWSTSLTKKDAVPHLRQCPRLESPGEGLLKRSLHSLSNLRRRACVSPKRRETGTRCLSAQSARGRTRGADTKHIARQRTTVRRGGGS